MNFLEGFYHLFFHPFFLLKQPGKPFSLSLFISLLSSFSLSALFGISSPNSCIFLSIFLFISYLLYFLFLSAFYHFISEFFKKKGNPGNLFSSFLLTSFPFVFLSPSAILFRSFQAEKFIPSIFLLFFLWIVILQIYAIKENYELEGGTAVFIYFIPFLGEIIFTFLLVFFSFIVSALLIGKFLPLFLTSIRISGIF